MTIEPLKVLFVEDNEDHAEMVFRSLRENKLGNSITPG